MQQEQYIPEVYWSDVAKRVRERKVNPLLAGDDDPYYAYKRKKFLDLLNSIDFKNKKVLELGCGPGGNLLEILNQVPEELTGADISGEMLALAKTNLPDNHVRLIQINNDQLPFPDNYFDISFTATVLQHVTDQEQFSALVSEISRVTRNDIFIFERITRHYKAKTSHAGRPVSIYTRAFSSNTFSLHGKKSLTTFWSWLFCGLIRKIFGRSTHYEGKPAGRTSKKLQSGILKITRHLDRLIPLRGDQAMLHFVKKR